MKGIPPPAQTNIELGLENPEKKVSIQSANLALNMARLEGKPEDVVLALIRLAHLYFRQGRYNQTQRMAEEVLCDAPSDSLIRCDALRMLGNCAAELGDPDGAENLYHQAVDLARQLDYRYALYKCLHSLATNIYWPRGQFDLCLAAGKEALLQAQALELGAELWFPLSDIAWVYWSTGQGELANQFADQIEKLVPPGSLGEGFNCCLRAGLLEPGEGYLDEFLPLYDRARSIAEATGDPGLNVEVRLGLCRSYRTVKDLPAAMTWAEDAVTVSVRLHYRQFQGLALIERGRILIEKGNLTRAEKDLRAALEIAAQLRSNFDLTRASLYLAALLSTQKKPEANAIWQQTVNLILDNGYTFLLEQERPLVLPWIAEMLDSADPILNKTSVVLFEIMTRVSPPPIQVKTYGQFALRVGANPISKENLRQRRAGELLALLLSSPGYTLSAEQVTEAMCPEKENSAAVDFYHHAISALRRLLEPDLPDRRFPCRYLEVSEERVILILPPGSKIDFLEFEQCLHNKDWEKTVGLYQGEYLPMFRYFEWTIALRQHYADQFEQALLALASERLSAGVAADCLSLAQRALLHNPWQEQAALLGMRAALEMNDRMTAIKLYQRLEKTLEKELGIAPQKELQQLYTEVRKRSRGK
jgi:DNA-binding SARP family transcriptional activator/Tfp pilus assembly protein PilF